MGLFDRSSSTNNTTLVDQTITQTEQTDQSGNQGLNLSGVGGAVSLDLSDRSRYSLNDNRSSVVTNSVSDSGAIAAGRDVGLGGLNLAGSALSTLQRVNADSLDLLGGLVDKSIDASRTAQRDAAQSSQSFLEQAVTGFGSLAKASTEGDADKMARVIGFALAAVAAVVVLPAIFKGGGKGMVIS